MSNITQVKRLLKKSNQCHWCGCNVVKYPLKYREKTPDNYATVDHIYSKLQYKRKIFVQGEQRIVLACHKCNRERNDVEVREHEKRRKNVVYSFWDVLFNIGLIFKLLLNRKAKLQLIVYDSSIQ